MNSTINGELIIIGGAEDKSGNREILRKVADMINKEKDTMIVSTLASDLGKEVGSDYKNLFQDLGVKNIEILDVSSREECEDKLSSVLRCGSLPVSISCWTNVLW